MTKTIDQIIAAGGGVVSLAGKLNITKGAVSQWKRVPLSRVSEVSKITGFSIAEMRPDFFGEQNKEAA